MLNTRVEKNVNLSVREFLGKIYIYIYFFFFFF